MKAINIIVQLASFQFARFCSSKISTFGSLITLVVTTATSHAQVLTPQMESHAQMLFAPGELLIQFVSTVTDAQIAEVFRQGGLRLLEHVRTPAMQEHNRIGLTRVNTTLRVEDTVRVLSHLPGVEFAEPNWLITPLAESNDPYNTDGWMWGVYGDDSPSPVGLAGTTSAYGTQTEKAWALGFTGSKDICVGIIDGGIQIDHPDLAANLWTNPGEIPNNGIDDDGNGYIDDVHGWNAANNNGFVSYTDAATDNHGTHVAGTIGAVGGNGIGVAGIAWNVTLIAGRVFNTNGSSGVWGAVQAIDYMTTLKTKKGLNIVALNHSWGGSGFSQSLLDALTRSAQAGILSVCAAGNATNNNDATPFYPASYNTSASAGYDGVISVAAITRDGTLASYSDYGQTSVDLGAPGGQYLDPTHYPELEIVSTVPPSTYDFKRGTSMAAPHVTGAIALYASTHPGSNPQQTRSDLLTAGVRPLPALTGITATGGALDVGSLMSLPANTSSTPNSPGAPQGVIGLGGHVDLSWTDQSANELGFAIERSTDGVNYGLVDTLGANRTTYSDRSVQSRTTYYYRLRAYNSTGTSDYTLASAPVSVPAVPLPAAPANLAVKTQPGLASLTWVDKSNNEEGFLVERKTGTGAWQFLASLALNSLSYADRSVVARTAYSYRVRTYNIAGNSAPSNEVTITAK